MLFLVYLLLNNYIQMMYFENTNKGYIIHDDEVKYAHFFWFDWKVEFF